MPVAKNKEEIPRLDIKQFKSVDRAIEEASSNLTVYMPAINKIGARLQEDQQPLRLFTLSALGRAYGLHAAAMREIANKNIHAVLVLLRAYLELLALTWYVNKHPKYVESLQESNEKLAQRKAPTRISLQKMFAAVQDVMPHGYTVYEDLSEVGHFGHTAMWAQWQVDEDGYMLFSSGWKSDEYPLIACATIIELSDRFFDGIATICVGKLGAFELAEMSQAK
jgi:hypothetical protein